MPHMCPLSFLGQNQTSVQHLVHLPFSDEVLRAGHVFPMERRMKVAELWGGCAGCPMSAHTPQDDGRIQVAGRGWAREVDAWRTWVSDLTVGFNSEGWVWGFGQCDGCWSGLTRGGLRKQPCLLWRQENNDLRGRGKLAEWRPCFLQSACGWGRMTGRLQVVERLCIPPACCTLGCPHLCLWFVSPLWAPGLGIQLPIWLCYSESKSNVNRITFSTQISFLPSFPYSENGTRNRVAVLHPSFPHSPHPISE